MIKVSEKKIIDFFFNWPTDTGNFHQVLSKHQDDIVLYKLFFFCADMSCEHEKRKKLPGPLKKSRILSNKTMKKPVFFDFFEFQVPGADISAPNFKNS
jgi:hypothetical protein